MQQVSNYDIIIGIDPGTKTGFAVWHKQTKKIIEINTIPIFEAFERVKSYKSKGFKLKVRFEDARQRQFLGNKGRDHLQGAGSIKRDCRIWGKFLQAEDIEFDMVPPRSVKTKVKPHYFKQLTGITVRTSEHARDACMLCFGF